MHMRTVIKAQASVIDETYALLQEAINAYLGTEDAAAAVQAQAAADLREVCHMFQHSVGQLQHHAKQAADLHTRAQGDTP